MFENSCILVCTLKKQRWLDKLPSSQVNEQIFLFLTIEKDGSKAFFNYFIKTTKYLNKHDLTFLFLQAERINFEFKLGMCIWQPAQMYLSRTAKYFILSPLFST